MKPLVPDKAVMFDRRDGAPVPGTPEFAIKANLHCPHCGIASDYAIALWQTDWPNIWTGDRVHWSAVQQEPKFYGYTEKQVNDIIAKETEF